VRGLVYLSDLVGRPLLDSGGTRVGRVRDAVARLQGALPPPLVGLLVRQGRRDLFLPWSHVARLDAHGAALAASRPGLDPFARRLGEILLGRDLMDSQVIDLRGPHVSRVNDVLLDHDAAGFWQVSGVQTGLRALARRILSPAVVAAPAQTRLLRWADLELLAGEIPAGLAPPDHHRLAALHPSDIARLADAVPSRLSAEIVTALDDQLAADTMEEMIDKKQADIVAAIDLERAAAILERMAPDAAADVLAHLPAERVDGVLRRMLPQDAADVHALLTYSAHTAGGLMTTDYLLAPHDLLVGDTIAYLRPQLARPDWIYYIYIVQDPRERRLAGVVSLRALLLADPTQRLEQIMARDLRHVAPEAPAARVAQIMSEYNLLALPVIDPQGRLLGIVSVDDALETILPANLRRHIPRVFS